jgi:hypothetical protein
MVSYTHLRSICAASQPGLDEFQKEMWSDIRDSGEIAYLGIWYPHEKNL